MSTTQSAAVYVAVRLLQLEATRKASSKMKSTSAMNSTSSKMNPLGGHPSSIMRPLPPRVSGHRFGSCGQFNVGADDSVLSQIENALPGFTLGEDLAGQQIPQSAQPSDPIVDNGNVDNVQFPQQGGPGSQFSNPSSGPGTVPPNGLMNPSIPSNPGPSPFSNPPSGPGTVVTKKSNTVKYLEYGAIAAGAAALIFHKKLGF